MTFVCIWCRGVEYFNVVDGKVQGPLTAEYMANNHFCGAFANDQRCWFKNNAAYVTVREYDNRPFRPPYAFPTDDGKLSVGPLLQHRIYLVATRDIRPFEEVFVSYGGGFWSKFQHFLPADYKKCPCCRGACRF